MSLLAGTGGGGGGGGSNVGGGGGGGGGSENVDLGGVVSSLDVAQGTPRRSTAHDALTLLQGDLVPHTNFTHTFLKSILTSIDSKDPGK